MKNKNKIQRTHQDTKETKPWPNISPMRDKLMLYTQIAIAFISFCALVVIAYQMTVQSRAWVTVKGAELRGIKEGQPITAKLVFHNSGKTPAMEVTIYNNINLFGQTVPDPMPYGSYVGHISKAVIGPDSDFGSFITKKEILTIQDIQAIVHRKANIYVYGRVDYRDIFHCQRYTEYCLVNKVGTLDFDVCEKHNTAN
ncbi:MAG: hypothetical protein ABSC54_07495 [Smithellaceae bacterium]|jgi:hypothetical protein